MKFLNAIFLSIVFIVLINSCTTKRTTIIDLKEFEKINSNTIDVTENYNRIFINTDLHLIINPNMIFYYKIANLPCIPSFIGTGINVEWVLGKYEIINDTLILNCEQNYIKRNLKKLYERLLPDFQEYDSITCGNSILYERNKFVIKEYKHEKILIPIINNFTSVEINTNDSNLLFRNYLNEKVSKYFFVKE